MKWEVLVLRVHELNVEEVRNVTFRDIDVLSVHGHGAVFSIHNYGQAVVEEVLLEDIRIDGRPVKNPDDL